MFTIGYAFGEVGRERAGNGWGGGELVGRGFSFIYGSFCFSLGEYIYVILA